MIHEKSFKQTTAVVLVALLVLSAFAPATIGAAAADSHDDEEYEDDTATQDNPYEDCADEAHSMQEAITTNFVSCADTITQEVSEDEYMNVYETLTYIQQNEFFNEEAATEDDKTPFVVAGDTTFRYTRDVSHEYKWSNNNGWHEFEPPKYSGYEVVNTRISEVEYRTQVFNYDGDYEGNITSGDIKEVNLEDFGVERNWNGFINSEDDFENLGFEFDDGFFDIRVFGESEVEIEDESSAFASSDMRDALEELTMDAGSDTGENGSSFIPEEPNLVSEFMEESSNTGTETRGSVVDYSLENTAKIPAFADSFKDSERADELFESRAMPPRQGVVGEIDDFERMTSSAGVAKIKPDYGSVYVGIGINRIPDSEQERGATLMFDTKTEREDIQLRIVSQNGDTIQSTTAEDNSIPLNNEVVKSMNQHNQMNLIVSGSNVNGNIKVSCVSVVTNTDSANECTEGALGEDELEIGYDTSETEFNDGNGTDVAGSILDYDISSISATERVEYATAFADGDSDTEEYLEKQFAATERPAGNIENFAQMIDGDAATSATVSGSENGLVTTTSFEGTPMGRNHITVLKYKVTSDEAPDIKLRTVSNQQVTVDGGELTVGETDTIAIDTTAVSDHINRNGALFLTFEGDSDTRMEVYCTSLIANIDNPNNVGCEGSLPEDSNTEGASVNSNASEVDETEIEPSAEFSVGQPDITANEQTEFDASESYDRDGTIETYEWTVVKQSGASETETTHETDDAEVEMTFSSPGAYEVTLKTIDNDGLTSQESKTVTVSDSETTKYTYKQTTTETKQQATSPGPEWEQKEVVQEDSGTTLYNWVKETTETETTYGSEPTGENTEVINEQKVKCTELSGDALEQASQCGDAAESNSGVLFE